MTCKPLSLLLLLCLSPWLYALPRTVHTATELTEALDTAKPGDVIVLAADTTFIGNFTIARSGTSAAPISLLGTATSVIDAVLIASGDAIHLEGAQYVVLEGFTVQHGRGGIILDRSKHNRIYGVTVKDTGEEAIHLRADSSFNTVENSTILNTGRADKGNGQGIDVGTANNRWCLLTQCNPDRSSENIIQTNHIGPGVTAECIAVREGTRLTLVNSNTLDGDDISGENHAHQFVDVAGNEATVEYNQASSPHGNKEIQNGVVVHSVFPNSGNNNILKSNTVSLNGSSGDGFGFYIVSATGTKLCDNNVVHEANSANMGYISCGDDAP